MALLRVVAAWILALFLSCSLSNSLIEDAESPTAYELLEGYNFPIGLLPKGVTKYELDPSTGKFKAYLNETCNFSLEGSYDVSYRSTISGYISHNKLTKLSGISVRILFFWLNIVEVTRTGDNIDFSVGITSASFALENFFECPQCGCGLDCDTVGNGKFSRNSGLVLPY